MTMQPLQCETCGLGVLVEKFSPAHTSIQWMSDRSECSSVTDGVSSVGDRGRTCSALRRTIDRAVARHELDESSIELPRGADLPRLH
ncbi:hypothetical protein [Rhodococcus sp. (in: high G+C Gram-positive bacteria)]|uniref:hypothetical protein n=1 Tax=Rhodococcus sp. TaxID=1831 RepID=UPI00388DFAB3